MNIMTTPRSPFGERDLTPQWRAALGVGVDDVCGGCCVPCMQNMSPHNFSYTGVKPSGPYTAPDHEPTTTTHGNGTTPRRTGGREGGEGPTNTPDHQTTQQPAPQSGTRGKGLMKPDNQSIRFHQSSRCAQGTSRLQPRISSCRDMCPKRTSAPLQISKELTPLERHTPLFWKTPKPNQKEGEGRGQARRTRKLKNGPP